MRTWARFVFITGIWGWSFADAQMPVTPTDRAKFNDIFDRLNGDKLDCSVRKFGPAVDFGFRFQLGYVVDCDVRQFGGLANDLHTFLRARPLDGAEAIFRDRIGVPKLAATKSGVDLRKVRANVEFSGALAAGMGEYEMELLVFDNRERLFRHSWRAKAFAHGKVGKVGLSMKPNSLAPLRPTPLPEHPGNNGSARLTVLMNAAPIFPQSLKLRIWDRAFLLDSLSSVLRQLSYSSVRVVAFNLDQQREIFRQDHFGESGMRDLAKALRDLELGTVSYDTLKQKDGWADLLLGLLHEEAQAAQNSDAVVFLGPMIRLTDKTPREKLAAQTQPPPPIFCVTYYPREGSDFPDSIQHLTSALKGKVFRIHNPGDLAENLEKLKLEIAGVSPKLRTQ